MDTEEKKDEYQNSLKTSPISFSPKDIKYIIIQEEKNRSKIINIIKKSNFFPDSDSKELAISKILYAKNESLCELKNQAEIYPGALKKSLINFFYLKQSSL